MVPPRYLAATLFCAAVPAAAITATETACATVTVTQTLWATQYPPLPFSTAITLNNAVLTGITIQPVSSSTCYRAPIPTQAVAVELNPSPVDLSSAPLVFYLGDQSGSTAIDYITATIDGNACLLDITSSASSTSRVTLTFEGGDSLVFDYWGLQLINRDCSSVSSVEISNFSDQVAQIATSSSTIRIIPVVAREFDQKNFTVEFQIEKELHDLLQAPLLTFGSSPCQLISRELDNTWGNLTFTCQYPGANSTQKACSVIFDNWLQQTFPSMLSPNLTNNPPNLLPYLPLFLSLATPQLSPLIPPLNPALHLATTWLTSIQSTFANLAQLGGNAICELIHAGDVHEIVFDDQVLPSPHTVGVFHSPPVDTVYATLAPHHTAATGEPAFPPPRQIRPSVTGLESVTVTSWVMPVVGTMGV